MVHKHFTAATCETVFTPCAFSTSSMHYIATYALLLDICQKILTHCFHLRVDSPHRLLFFKNFPNTCKMLSPKVIMFNKDSMYCIVASFDNATDTFPQTECQISRALRTGHYTVPDSGYYQLPWHDKEGLQSSILSTPLWRDTS